ncbi:MULTISPECIES: hypothetical protein [Asaia]|uniref:hypothetical protein n=1 Tax=Asaia TaxID=91914 RepID=UPI002FC2CD87
MSGKWTPGPWVPDFGEVIRIRDASGATLATVTHTHLSGKRDLTEVGASARLIAAAPELAEALEALLSDAMELLKAAAWGYARQDITADDLEERGFAPESFGRARAALAKAKGEGA